VSVRSNHAAVREFFERQNGSSKYAPLKAMTRELDLAAADVLHASICGEVLAIGGVWDHFDWVPAISSLTVLDLSMEMLNDYCPDGAERVEGDLYDIEFAPASFDTVVFPLMLHHTPVGDWKACEQRVHDAIARATCWLRPGGRIFIVEYCPHPVWEVVERLLLPVTRRFLTAFGQPLVVMYGRGFYVRALEHGFGHVRAERIDPAGFNYWTWYPIFMSIRWLRIPLALYPKMHVFEATDTEG
jgi:SAM-dependent methyltransferase